jgi:cellulose synthase (UDP-forming)
MAIELKLKKKKLLLVLVIIGIICSFDYFRWWFSNDRILNPIYIILLIPILFYIIAQVYFLWIIYLNAKYPKKKKSNKKFDVDVFLPTYNEPLEMVEKTLKAVVEMNYPHSTYLIDDGNKNEFKLLASKYNAKYINRDNNRDFKAGNINNVLKYSKGEIIAVFDIDHVPQKNYLDDAIKYFEDSKIGVVQVALDHYNQSESYVADACCTMNDDFFAGTMLGMNELDCAVIFGSNSIFRREALLSIGGYKPGLAEDLHTSINLHAAGWKSAYVAEILAKGLVPADLAAFFKQQLKWANGVFEVLLKYFPPLFSSLNIKQIICYSTRMTYYLAGPVFFIHIIATIISLFSSNFNAEFSNYIVNSLPFVIMFLLIQVYVKIFYFIKEKKKGFHVNGYLLVLGSWPIYTVAFISALFGIKIPFIATPKNVTSENIFKLIIPQVLFVLTLIIGIVYKVINYRGINSIIIILFSLTLIMAHYGVFYGFRENYLHRKKNKYNPVKNVQKEKEIMESGLKEITANGLSFDSFPKI